MGRRILIDIFDSCSHQTDAVPRLRPREAVNDQKRRVDDARRNPRLAVNVRRELAPTGHGAHHRSRFGWRPRLPRRVPVHLFLGPFEVDDRTAKDRWQQPPSPTGARIGLLPGPGHRLDESQHLLDGRRAGRH